MKSDNTAWLSNILCTEIDKYCKIYPNQFINWRYGCNVGEGALWFASRMSEGAEKFEDLMITLIQHNFEPDITFITNYAVIKGWQNFLIVVEFEDLENDRKISFEGVKIDEEYIKKKAAKKPKKEPAALLF